MFEPVIAGAVAALISIFAPLATGEPSGESLRVPGWLSFIRLSYVRTAGATVFGLAASAAIDLSLSNHSHHLVTYVIFYGVALLGLTVAIGTTVVIDRETFQSPWPGFVANHHRSPGVQSPTATLADLYKEGDDFRSECAALPSGSLALKARWRLIGGTPQEQCAREEQARQWDEKVSLYLWNEPTLKQFGPGWRPAGRSIAKATDHPNQSMMNPDRLADWYDGKLDYLRSVIERCGPLSSEAQRPAQSS